MRRVLTYIVWAIVLVVLALVFILGGSSLALALAVLALVLPLAGLVLVSFATGKVDGFLVSPTSAAKDSDIVCELFVRNASPMPLLRIEVSLEVTNLLTSQTRSDTIRVSAAPRSTVRTPFTLESDVCGRLDCRVTTIRVFEPFTLFSRSRACEADRRLSVMPTLHEAYLRDSLSAAPISDTTTFSPFTKGRDLSEVYSLRGYEPGDDLRTIHWKLSDKLDGLIVREPSLPLDNSLLVFWDKGLYGCDADPARADAMAEVMLALSERLVADGVSFDVAFNDVVSGRCEREYISDENDIYELIGHLMSTPLGHADESGMDTYARLYGGLAFSRIIYVSAGMPADMEETCRGKRGMALICDDDESMRSTPTFTEIHFDKGDAPSALLSAGVV